MMKNGIWVISSKGEDQKYNLSNLDKSLKGVIVKEYAISSIAHKLLNPNPIETEKLMIGCIINYKPKSIISEKITDRLPVQLQDIVFKLFPPKALNSDVVMASGGKLEIPKDFDENLTKHAQKIKTMLKSYQAFNRELREKVHPDTTESVTGVYLHGDELKDFQLQGNLLNQANYALKNLGKKIKINLPGPQRGDGKYDMNEMDFTSFKPDEKYRLLCFELEGNPIACVLDSERKMQYIVQDTNAVKDMHLFDLAINTNQMFERQMMLYVQGRAQPRGLTVQEDLDIAWAEDNLPAFYERASQTFDLGDDDKHTIVDMLKEPSFSSVGLVSSLANQTFVSYATFHDFDKIKPMAEKLPHLYNAIKHNTYDIEGKKMYLVDVIGGPVEVVEGQAEVAGGHVK